MKKHTKIYYDFFGLTISDFVPCEICGKPANDIHHIHARGMGGDPLNKKDVIENLMAVCRDCHNIYGDVPEQIDFLNEVHKRTMTNGILN